MTSTLEAQHISVSINRPFVDVNDFLSQPTNFGKWAAGLGKGFKQVNGEWIFETGDGIAKIRFTAKNGFGVADHYVFPQPEIEIYVPLRVVPNKDGSEVILTLFRQPEMTAAQFEADQEAVRRDLEMLKTLLEK